MDHTDKQIFMSCIGEEFDVSFTAVMANHGETRSLIFFSVVIPDCYKSPVYLIGFPGSSNVAICTVTLRSYDCTLHRDK